MAKLLMNLRYVTDEEAEEVRELLGKNGIDYYETPPNRWGFTIGGIWLRNQDQFPDARRRLDEYQQQRSTRVRAEYEAARQRGELDTLPRRFQREPVRTVLYFALALAIASIMTVPFVNLALRN